ncbi:unnamed protein product [Adineta steineri]|uniref:Transmembrane protein n=1 Tax=Adineta steineri TaxID=433720 RepID=A0A819M656_9BILA|nr:unnamed protein product [Adineta steineri]
MFIGIFILLLILKPIVCVIIYDTTDDNAHGVRIAGNDQFIVYGINLAMGFDINFAPFVPLTDCVYVNTSRDFYVYSLDVVFNNDNNTSDQLFTFVQISEQMSTQNVYFSIITVNKSLCINGNMSTAIIRDTLIWNGTHQQYMLLKVIPSQKYACVFADSFVLMFDIVNNEIIGLTDSYTFYSYPYPIIIPHAIDVTDTYVIGIAYAISYINPNTAIVIAFLCELQPFRSINYTTIYSDVFYQTADLAKTYNIANQMSIAVNNKRQMAVFGFPFSSAVLLFNINMTSTDASQWNMNIMRTDFGPPNSGFGQSVAWLDDKTVAILLLSINARSWSQSEVWTFAVDRPLENPLSVFPNNQQTLNLFVTPKFLQIVLWSSNLYILTDNGLVILVPSQAPGYQSIFYDSVNTYTFIYQSAPCRSGTYKNEVGYGICTICSPQTKNPGNKPAIECSSCLSNSFCPLGSIDDVTLINYTSYIQTFTYPDSPDMNNYDDIIVQNIFSIGHSVRCLIIAPLFWTSLAIVLCFIIWFIMTMGKIFNCQIIVRHRDNAKKFLKNTDIVGDGERWIGGLSSFAIVVLFGFTFWFAADYHQLYPIETSGPMHASCDTTMRNAIFDNALQLPLSNTDGSQWPIFDMLNTQPFTMSLDLVNTAANCQNITIQQNRPGVKYLKLSNLSCLIQPDNVTLTATFPLPQHQLEVQLNISGIYSIGGIRLCVRGPGIINGVNTLQALDTCKLLFTINETLARTSTVSISLIKVINQTKPLEIGDSTVYGGRWSPTINDISISDKLVYEQDGEYLRYVNERTTFIITISEQPFFLQNNQQPIVRISELAFHTLLFCTLIIELFAMAFLLFKLIVKPLIHLFLRCRNKKTKDKHKQKNIHDIKKRQSSLSLSSIERRHNQKKQRRQQKQKQKQEKNIVYSIPYISSDLPHRNDDIYWDRTQI